MKMNPVIIVVIVLAIILVVCALMCRKREPASKIMTAKSEIDTDKNVNAYLAAIYAMVMGGRIKPNTELFRDVLEYFNLTGIISEDGNIDNPEAFDRTEFGKYMDYVASVDMMLGSVGQKRKKTHLFFDLE